MSARTPLLEVRNLKKHYPLTEGILKKKVGSVKAVDGISFSIYPGETLGIVGESGCGKSTAATSLLRLEEPTDGSVVFRGDDITTYDARQLKAFRRHAQMIFQNPDSSFDPRMSVGESVAEPLLIHGINDRERRRRIVQDLLERVGLSAEDVDRYPHEFSGGQKQRIALARALVVNPELIVADEPTSALDVSIQAEVLTVLQRIQQEFGLSMLFISHDMGVIRQVCDRVAVMYLGEIVEIGETERLFTDPKHPYTQALLSSIPQPDPRQRGTAIELTGDLPNPSNPPTGCRFHTRCPEIIQPNGYDFEQSEWRAVMDLRVRLSRGALGVDAAREFAATEAGVEPGAVSDDRVATAIRDEFDIPRELSDGEAESVLSKALASILDGDHAAAAESLGREFETICEREPPRLVSDTHDVSTETWRSVTEFRSWLIDQSHGDGSPPDAARSVVETRGAGGSSLDRRLRDAFGFPSQIGDPVVEEAVETAVQEVNTDSLPSAITALDRLFADAELNACHLNRSVGKPMSGHAATND